MQTIQRYHVLPLGGNDEESNGPLGCLLSLTISVKGSIRFSDLMTWFLVPLFHGMGLTTPGQNGSFVVCIERLPCAVLKVTHARRESLGGKTGSVC